MGFVTAEQSAQLFDEDQSLELKLADVGLILKHLSRKRLVSAKGLEALALEAQRLELPPPANNEPPRDAPSVDVDQLLLRWMAVWGSWEWREDRQLLQSVMQRFQMRGTSPAKAAGARQAASPVKRH